MAMSVTQKPGTASKPGAVFLRAVQSIARSGSDSDAAIMHAANVYGSNSRVVEVVRALVDGDWGAILATPEGTEFFGVVANEALIGKLNLRPVPLNVRTVLMTSGFVGYWVGRGKAKPLSRAAVEGGTLSPAKVAVLAALTKESVRASGPAAEARFRDAFLQALVEAIDAALIDPDNAGIPDEMPAAITHGVTPIASTGDPNADLRALIAAFTGDLASASWVSDPVTGAEIALARDATGGYLFPDAGPRGGSLLNIPFVTSRASPRTSSGGLLALVDGSGVAYGAEGVRTALSQHSTLEMVDDTSDPPAAEHVSLFQSNTLALLSEIAVNWRVVRAGSVVYVADAKYDVAP